MQLIIQGHGIELTGPLRDYAAKKIGKLEEFYSNIQKVHVVLDARCHDDSNRSHVAEVSIWLSGKKVINASEAGQDMYAAIDMVLNELERQVKKHKEKHVKETRRSAEKIKQISHSYLSEIPEEAGQKLAKLKRFNITTMTRDEALKERQELGHDFFMFRNAETGEINVVHDGGVIADNDAETLSENEAAKHLAKQKSAYLAFKNADTNEMNVVYKRKSGNLGLIEPSA